MDKVKTCQPLVKVHLGKPEFRRRPVYELALTPEIGWEQAPRKCSNVQARLEDNFGSKELTSTLRVLPRILRDNKGSQAFCQCLQGKGATQVSQVANGQTQGNPLRALACSLQF